MDKVLYFILNPFVLVGDQHKNVMTGMKDQRLTDACFRIA